MDVPRTPSQSKEIDDVGSDGEGTPRRSVDGNVQDCCQMCASPTPTNRRHRLSLTGQLPQRFSVFGLEIPEGSFSNFACRSCIRRLELIERKVSEMRCDFSNAKASFDRWRSGREKRGRSVESGCSPTASSPKRKVSRSGSFASDEIDGERLISPESAFSQGHSALSTTAVCDTRRELFSRNMKVRQHHIMYFLFVFDVPFLQVISSFT